MQEAISETTKIQSLLALYDTQPQDSDLLALSQLFSPYPLPTHYLHPLHKDYPIPLSGIHILFGPQGSGRRSRIHYSNLPSNHPILQLYCGYLTELQFSKQLLRLLAKAQEVQQPSGLIINDQISFTGLTPIVHKGKHEKLLLVITRAEKLTEMKKQMLMYGLLEWVKKEVPDRVALYLVTARTDFCQHLEKRVKSRLTANFVFWQPPTAKGVLEAVRLRVLLGGRCWRVGKGLMGVLGDQRVVGFVEEMMIGGDPNMGAMMNVFRNALIMCKSKQLEKQDPTPYFLSVLQKSLSQIYPNHCLLSLQNLNIPDLVVLAHILTLTKKQQRITLQAILTENIESKKRLVSSGQIGTIFNYSSVALQRGFENLIANRVMELDANTSVNCGTAHALMSYKEMEGFLRGNREVPNYVRNLLEEAGA